MIAFCDVTSLILYFQVVQQVLLRWHSSSSLYLSVCYTYIESDDRDVKYHPILYHIRNFYMYRYSHAISDAYISSTRKRFLFKALKSHKHRKTFWWDLEYVCFVCWYESEWDRALILEVRQLITIKRWHIHTLWF